MSRLDNLAAEASGEKTPRERVQGQEEVETPGPFDHITIGSLTKLIWKIWIAFILASIPIFIVLVIVLNIIGRR